MYQVFKEWLDDFWLVLAISLFGGVAHMAKHQINTIFGGICCLIVACFSGFVTWMALKELEIYWELTEQVHVLLICVSAYSGGRTLEIFMDKVVTILQTIFTFKQK